MDWNYLSIDIIGGTMVTIYDIINACCNWVAIDINDKEDLVILTIGVASFVYIMVSLTVIAGYLISMGAEWLLSLI